MRRVGLDHFEHLFPTHGGHGMIGVDTARREPCSFSNSSHSPRPEPKSTSGAPLVPIPAAFTTGKYTASRERISSVVPRKRFWKST